MEYLPPLNYNAFVYLISFMRDVIAQGSYNRCVGDGWCGVGDVGCDRMGLGGWCGVWGVMRGVIIWVV